MVSGLFTAGRNLFADSSECKLCKGDLKFDTKNCLGVPDYM
jgi:hypothetical protein